MKILYLTNLYPPYNVGGYELICQTVNRAMQARGHETRVLTSNHQVAEKGLPADEEGVERTLRVHGCFGRPSLGIARLRTLELYNNKALRKTLAEFQPDVVHVFNLGGISKSLAHTLQRSDVPTVYFLSDHWLAQSLAADVWLDWWNRPPTSRAQCIVRSTLERTGFRGWIDAHAPTLTAQELEFRRIYFCSEFLRNQAVECGYDVAHGGVIRNSVDTVRFSPPPAPKPSRCERFLFVGRLNPEKGARTVLRAIARIRDSFGGSVTFCGRGEPAFELEMRALAQSQRLPVEFMEATSAMMPEIYRQHDALIFASEWEEPFALTPLEAMSCGLPVIATTTGGSVELFRDNVNSLTFKAGDHEDLSQPELRRRIAAAGCAQVRKELREEIVMDRVEEYVRETVAGWPAFTPGRPTATQPSKSLAYA